MRYEISVNKAQTHTLTLGFIIASKPEEEGVKTEDVVVTESFDDDDDEDMEVSESAQGRCPLNIPL